MPFPRLVQSQDRRNVCRSAFGEAPFSRFLKVRLSRTLGSLVVSLSNGSLCLLSPTEGSTLAVTETWHAHDYEPWIAAWNYWDTNVIYSGSGLRHLALISISTKASVLQAVTI